jgi:hypothetical protein
MKLVVSNGGSGKPELYDLSKDLAEAKDLAGSQPDKARQLQALYNAWSSEQAEPSAPDAPGKAKKAAKKNKAKAS